MAKNKKSITTYQEYLDKYAEEKKENVKTYIELPKELWDTFKSKSYKTAGYQVGELIFNALDVKFTTKRVY